MKDVNIAKDPFPGNSGIPESVNDFLGYFLIEQMEIFPGWRYCGFKPGMVNMVKKRVEQVPIRPIDFCKSVNQIGRVIPDPGFFSNGQADIDSDFH
jgi:hypothetical protein